MGLQLEGHAPVNGRDQQLARGRRSADEARPVAEREETRLVKSHLQKTRLVAQAVERLPELRRAESPAPAAVAQTGPVTPRVLLSRAGRKISNLRERIDECENEDCLFH